MRDSSSFPQRYTTRGNKIASSRRAVSVGQKRQWMNERVSFEIKRKSPPAPPFSSLHQSQLYPLSPLLSFIITARDFIPALEAAGRPARCSARKKEEGETRWTFRARRRAQSTFGTEITVKLSALAGVRFLEEEKSFEPSGRGPDLVAETETKPPSLLLKKEIRAHTVSNLRNFSTGIYNRNIYIFRTPLKRGCSHM